MLKGSTLYINSITRWTHTRLTSGAYVLYPGSLWRSMSDMYLQFMLLAPFNVSLHQSLLLWHQQNWKTQIFKMFWTRTSWYSHALLFPKYRHNWIVPHPEHPFIIINSFLDAVTTTNITHSLSSSCKYGHLNFTYFLFLEFSRCHDGYPSALEKPLL